MYYYISRDARKWTKLNNNQRVNAEYRGHPDIIKGHDNRYYMIGVSEKNQKPLLWTSSDLVVWSIERNFQYLLLSLLIIIILKEIGSVHLNCIMMRIPDSILLRGMQLKKEPKEMMNGEACVHIMC